ncbi:MAG TPA: hypothetical protein VKP64_00005, partial [Mycobacteriales bacterium]|nr:hypothetical protein [Mycobacteriales bacterium]
MSAQLRSAVGPTPNDALPRAEAARRHRVLHVITHLDEGGAQDNTLLTVEGLDRNRYEVHLLGGPGALESRAAEVADRVIVLPYLRRPLVSLGDVRVFWTLVRLASEYDVVHTHGSKAGGWVVSPLVRAASPSSYTPCTASRSTPSCRDPSAPPCSRSSRWPPTPPPHRLRLRRERAGSARARHRRARAGARRRERGPGAGRGRRAGRRVPRRARHSR